MTETAQLKSALADAERWIDGFMAILGWHDREKSLRALNGAMHAFRDSLPWDEAAQVAACLSPLIRGLFLEGWHATSPSLPLTNRSVLLERVHDAVHREPGIDPELVMRAFMTLLARRLPQPELEDAKAMTADELRALWPA